MVPRPAGASPGTAQRVPGWGLRAQPQRPTRPAERRAWRSVDAAPCRFLLSRPRPSVEVISIWGSRARASRPHLAPCPRARSGLFSPRLPDRCRKEATVASRRTRLIAAGMLALMSAASTGALAAEAPAGQMSWALHFSLAPTLFEPAETPGLITPFMMLYAL